MGKPDGDWEPPSIVQQMIGRGLMTEQGGLILPREPSAKAVIYEIVRHPDDTGFTWRCEGDPPSVVRKRKPFEMVMDVMRHLRNGRGRGLPIVPASQIVWRMR